MSKKFLVALLFIGILLTGCNDEKNYENALEKIKNSELVEAENLLNKVDGNYKDNAILKAYVNANSKLSEYDETQLNDYSNIIFELNTAIPEDYDGDLNEEINKFRDYILEKQNKYEVAVFEEIEDMLSEALIFVSIKQLNEALDKIVGFSHKDAKNVYYYLNAALHLKKYNAESQPEDYIEYIESLLKVDENYKGFLAKELDYIMGKRTDMISKLIDFRIYNEMVEKANSIPEIGMTASEVTDTSWGEPIRINKTETINGIYEQWVFYDFKYVYLSNGIVTAIQE